MRLIKQLLVVGAVLLALAAILMTFSFDIVKVYVTPFMAVQASYSAQEEPRPVPAQSIPVQGPAYIPGEGAPENPIEADETSIARGAQLYQIHCQMCHGDGGQGNGTIAAFLVKKKPANLTSEAAQSKSDGDIFLIITNGIFNPNNTLFPETEFSGQMPPLNENLSVRERWDVVNYLRTLKAAE